MTSIFAANPMTLDLGAGTFVQPQGLPLSTTEARVWWATVPEMTGDKAEQAEETLETLLSDDELERASRFRVDKDRNAYIAAHALGRILLSHATGEAPDFWTFEIGDRGKPEVVCPAGLPRLRLNLSHTDGLVTAALTIDRNIGVDVEHFNRSPNMDLVARRVFSDAECAEIFRDAGPQRLQTFLRFWTLKEAYVKAIGKGLAQPLKRISFVLGTEETNPRVHFDGSDAADEGWNFMQVLPSDDHVLAVALESQGMPAEMKFQEVRFSL